MSIICPTITADNIQEYSKQLIVASNLSKRVHIDYSDGTMTERKLLGIEEINWPNSELLVDIHLMSIALDINFIVSKTNKFNLVIVHAEANLDIPNIAGLLKRANTKIGLALLEKSDNYLVEKHLDLIDHVLIFSGNLGYQGGSKANLDLLARVAYFKSKKPSLEIGWDGGINDQNIQKISQSGVDVLNVGGFIAHSANPKEAYAKLDGELNKTND